MKYGSNRSRVDAAVAIPGQLHQSINRLAHRVAEQPSVDAFCGALAEEVALALGLGRERRGDPCVGEGLLRVARQVSTGGVVQNVEARTS